MLLTAAFGRANTNAPVYYRILNSDKTVSVSRTNVGVSEDPVGSGNYIVTITEASISGKTIIWDINGTVKVASDTVVPPTGTSNILLTGAFGAINTGKAVYYEILNSDGSTYQARTNTGVTELITGSGLYGVTEAITSLRERTVVWDIAGVQVACDEFIAVTTGGSAGIIVHPGMGGGVRG